MSNRMHRRRVEALLTLSRALATEVNDLISRMAAQGEADQCHVRSAHAPSLGQHQIRRQLRLRFPYAVTLHLPMEGLGARLPRLRGAAARLCRTPHAEWLEQVNGSYFMVLGFHTADEMDSLRGWVLQQGWAELLSPSSAPQ